MVRMIYVQLPCPGQKDNRRSFDSGRRWRPALKMTDDVVRERSWAAAREASELVVMSNRSEAQEVENLP
jgi:hypothetical protein